MRVAIIGAGWAGIAATSQCLIHGLDVTLYDAAHVAGGRARVVTDPVLGEIDNGQHLLIGGYQTTLNLIRRDLGNTHLKSSLKREPLRLQSVDGQFRLQRRQHNALALWTAKGLSLRDKWQVSSLLWRLKSTTVKRTPQSPSFQTVAQWLASEGQSANACRWLWNPLCLAALNTNPEQACAHLFQSVLRDSFLSSQSDATDLLIPTQNLTDLWPAAVAQRVRARWGSVVRDIVPTSNGVTIEGEPYDACVLAIPPTNLARLTASIPEFSSLRNDLSQFEFRSITTCYVSVRHHQPLPAPMLMFDHAAVNEKQPAQWVFDRTQIMGHQVQAQLAFVISCSDDLALDNDSLLANQLIVQLQSDLPSYSGEIIDAKCLRDKRATFAALPNLVRPRTSTWHPRIKLAGDWTDTGYPAVIEGAVISGVRAADEIASLVEKA